MTPAVTSMTSSCILSLRCRNAIKGCTQSNATQCLLKRRQSKAIPRSLTISLILVKISLMKNRSKNLNRLIQQIVRQALALNLSICSQL